MHGEASAKELSVVEKFSKQTEVISKVPRQPPVRVVSLARPFTLFSSSQELTPGYVHRGGSELSKLLQITAFTNPVSSSRVIKTTPPAVPGRCRQMTRPHSEHCRCFSWLTLHVHPVSLVASRTRIGSSGWRHGLCEVVRCQGPELTAKSGCGDGDKNYGYPIRGWAFQ